MLAVIRCRIFCLAVSLSKNVYIKIYTTIILTVVLYGCETWSLTLREEHRLKVSRRIFGPKRDEVTREWTKIHNEELNDLHSSPNTIWMIKIKKNEMGGSCSTYGREDMCIQGLGGESEGKRAFVRPRR